MIVSMIRMNVLVIMLINSTVQIWPKFYTVGMWHNQSQISNTIHTIVLQDASELLKVDSVSIPGLQHLHLFLTILSM